MRKHYTTAANSLRVCKPIDLVQITSIFANNSKELANNSAARTAKDNTPSLYTTLTSQLTKKTNANSQQQPL